MKKIAFLLLLTIPFLLACKKGHLQDHSHHRKGSANEYMHRSSTESLIRNFEKPERADYQQPEKVIDYMGVTSGMTIMDLGAGSGYFTFRLAEAGAKVIAADVDDDFQAYIRKKMTENGMTEEAIELRKIPYDDPLLKAEEVDRILIVNTYHHIEDRVAYFKKARLGLKAGGQLVVVDYFKKDIPVGPPRGHKLAKEIVERELREAGYQDIVVNTELLPYQYVITAK